MWMFSLSKQAECVMPQSWGFQIIEVKREKGQTTGCLPLCLIESGEHLSAPNASPLTMRVSTAEIKPKTERA